MLLRDHCQNLILRSPQGVSKDAGHGGASWFETRVEFIIGPRFARTR